MSREATYFILNFYVTLHVFKGLDPKLKSLFIAMTTAENSVKLKIIINGNNLSFDWKVLKN